MHNVTSSHTIPAPAAMVLRTYDFANSSIAQLQLAAGAVGITCAKVAEAEVFVAAGCHDIVIAYPVAGARTGEAHLAIKPPAAPSAAALLPN